MLLCRLTIRTLHHSHNRFPSPTICTSQRTWLQAPRSYSSASGGDQQDEELDLSRLPADSAYLDFLLGPADASSASSYGKEVENTSAAASTRSESSHNAPNARTTLSLRRTRREQVKHALANASRRRKKDVASNAKIQRTVQQISQWHLDHDGQEGPTVSVRRLVPAVAPAREASQLSGLEHWSLKLNRRQRASLQRRTRTIRSAVTRSQGTEKAKRNHGQNATPKHNSRRKRLAQRMGKEPAAYARPNQPFFMLRLSHTQDWQENFAKLQSSFDKRSSHYGQEVSLPKLHPNAGAWAAFALEAGNSGRLWRPALGKDLPYVNLKKRWYWEQAALWILSHEPERAVEFLVSTHRCCNARTVVNILQHLADKFTHPQDNTGAKNLAALADAFPRLADRGIRRPLRIGSSFLRLLMPHSSHDQINELYRAIKDHRVMTTWLTWLHFATRFARSGQFEHALDATIESSRAGAAHDSTAFRSTCATLLRAAIKEPSGLRVCLRVIDKFVDLGVTLNIRLCNIVMLNAVEAGDQRTAFAVYNSLVEHGLQADAYTYAILLKGCKAAIDDADGLNTTIRHAIEHIGIANEPVVATEIIHCLALHHTRHNPDNAFDTIADGYAQLFDLEPLRKLGIVLPHLSARVHPDKQRMQPPKHVVEIMIAAHLEHMYQRTQSTTNAYELYRRFLELADAGEEPFRALLETDHAANAFMMTFGKTKKGLLHSAQVIKDMQRDTRVCCRPTVQTWTIFLYSFTRHGQMKLAEQVLSYMKSKDMTPNEVTWNVLTAGYATAQDVHGTLDALRRMERDGKVWDRWTEGGLKSLKDQQALAQLTQSQYTMRLQADVDADIKEGLRDRISALEADKVEERQHREESTADSPADVVEADDVVDTVYKPF
ncbi:hypothetical protein CLAFUW4_14093 [Fulvia fulva]|nr:hypothetical protein CLAFUR4_14096 [Fulvia fulva]WPV22390.1 hypothetical protein CLAFUW4_14093 [Fulvia fulva]